MKRILIIEDVRTIRMALEDDFKFEGYQVDSAATGPEGLEKAMERSEKIKYLSLGGAVAGYEEEVYKRFVQKVEKSRYRERFILKGWAAPDEITR